VKASRESEAYWRDAGTIDAYWEANIDLTSILPGLDMYDHEWPIWTYAEITPPAKFVHAEEGRRGFSLDSLVSGGCIISGAAVFRSLLFSNVRVHSYAHLDGAVLQPDIDVGRGARLTNVVVDRGVKIPAGLVVGEDAELDSARFRRTDKGIVLITQPMIDRLSL
jgi:glucose-1-phosphate adenylyltransferase